MTCNDDCSSDTSSVDLLVVIVKFIGTIRTEPCVKMNSVIKILLMTIPYNQHSLIQNI